MDARPDVKVVIIGAGPVGLTAAAELARFGVPCRLVDKAPQASTTSKALVVWSRTLEMLDRLGCGEAFVAAGRKALGASIFAQGEPIGQVGFAHVAGPHPYALMLPQSETERLLAEHLQGVGVAIERGVEATRIEAAEDSIALDLRHPDGRAESVRCDWLIGCDGAHSALRHALGVPFAGSTLPSDWILGDVHLRGMPVPDTEVCLFWHASGVLAVFPIEPGRYRVIADVGVADAGAKPPDPSLAEIQAIIDERGPAGVVASDPIWLSGFRINERKVADYRVGRAFLAGDAAHVHSPAGGQGMNTGMQDAANLAWKLALVVRGEARPEPLLASYSAERSAIGTMVLKNAGRLTTLALVRNPALQAMRNHVAQFLFGLDSVRDRMADTLSEATIRYTDGPLVVPGGGHGGPASGEALVPAAGETPIGAGRAPRFTLLSSDSPEAAALVGRFPTLIDPVLRAPLSSSGMWLVRPDGYVAVAAASAPEVGAYLDQFAI